MITFHNISYSFDDKDIFHELQLAINPGDRVALIGNNGTGKTTLLRLAVGEIKPTEGVIANSFVHMGYVRQSLDQTELVALLFDDCEHWRVLAALNDMSLDETVLRNTIQELSGGQATRVQPAAILARESSELLILDEPTNNLDREAIEWLSGFLALYKGTVLSASHDRSFIDQFAARVWEIKDKSIVVHNGNYTDYRRALDVASTHQMHEYEKEQKEKQKLKKLLANVQLSASTALRTKNVITIKCFVTSRLKASKLNLAKKCSASKHGLSRWKRRKRYEIQKIYKTSLVASGCRSGTILNVQQLSKKAFNLGEQNFALKRGQRLYVAGKNGSGKSTLLDILAGRERDYEGLYKWSPTARVGYFSQDVYGIDINLSVLEVLSGYYDDTQDVYRQCKTQGLNPIDVQRKVMTLSRGQQAKVGFVLLLLQSYDVLILDEPTNHLDVSSRAIIENALAKYEGAIIYTSHDAFFVEQIGYDAVIRIG